MVKLIFNSFTQTIDLKSKLWYLVRPYIRFAVKSNKREQQSPLQALIKRSIDFTESIY